MSRGTATRTPAGVKLDSRAEVAAKVTKITKPSAEKKRSPFERAAHEDMQTPLRTAIWRSASVLMKGRKLINGGVQKIIESLPLANLNERLVQRVVADGRAAAARAPDGWVESLPRKRKGRAPTTGGSKFTEAAAKKLLDIDTAHWGRLKYRQLAYKMTAAGFPVSHVTVREWTKILHAKLVRRYIKPSLTNKHRMDRLDWVLRNEVVKEGGTTRFTSNLNTAHGDESWMYLMEDGVPIRIYPDKDGTYDAPEPARVRHKSHIPKCMFLVVNARPRPEYGFDGKIGVWEFATVRVSDKTGKEVVDKISVDAEAYRAKIISKGGVFDAMREKMWWFKKDATYGRFAPEGKSATDKTPEAGEPLYYQHDGARPHTAKANERVWATHGAMKGFQIRVVTQPAQSPDLNINDLCFFRSLKSRIAGRRFSTLVEMMKTVKLVYAEYDAETLERAWRVLFTVYRGILRVKGDNNYSTHGNASKRWRHGLEADRSLPSPEIIAAAREEYDKLAEEAGYDPASLDSESSDDADSESDSESDDDDDERPGRDGARAAAEPAQKRPRRGI